MASDMAAFLAAGNTQPGGFYRGGVEEEDDFGVDDTTKAAGPGQENVFCGNATMRLYSDFVQDSCSGRSKAPRLAAAGMASGSSSAHPANDAKREWRLTDELMQQPWGAVLRALEPKKPGSSIEQIVASRRSHAGRAMHGGNAFFTQH